MKLHTLCLGEDLLGYVARYNHLPSLLLFDILGLVGVQRLGLGTDKVVPLAVAARNGQGIVVVPPIGHF